MPVEERLYAGAAGKIHKAEAVPAVAGFSMLEQSAAFQIDIAGHHDHDIVFAQVQIAAVLLGGAAGGDLFLGTADLEAKILSR